MVAAIVIGVVAYSQLSGSQHSTTTTSGSTTSPTTIRLANINSCQSIDAPGQYYITSDIQTSIQDGSCISIRSGNVKLVGNGHKITGNGPFVNGTSYSYGISIRNQTNVSVSQLSISKFSFGVYLLNSSNSLLSGINVTNSTVSSIYMYKSSNNSVSDSRLSGALGSQGSLVMEGGSGNQVQGTTVDYNTYYGIYINGTASTLLNDTLSNNKADLYCAPDKGYPSSSSFSGSSCYINDYCNFAQCSQTNLFQDLSAIPLQQSISSCGDIGGSGTYTLSKNLDMKDYVNRTGPSSNSLACITISAPSVYLNCSNMSISNAGIGILALLTSNVVVANCRVYNSTTGIKFSQVVGGSIRGGTASGNMYSVYIDNSSLVNVTGMTQHGNKYGTYLNSSFITNVKGVSSLNGSYGVYIDNANVTSIINSTVKSNSKTDLYCTPNSYNSSTDSVVGTSCGSTDCTWASSSCSKYVLPPIATFPISSCMTISASGNYSLSQDVLSSGTCFRIDASNVTINCDGHLVLTSTGTHDAFSVSGKSNVSISNCNILNYAHGINATNTKNLSLSKLTINNTQTAVLLTNSSLAKLSSVAADVFSRTGFTFNRLTKSNVSQSIALNGATNATGFLIMNSTGNSFTHNYANQSAYGYYITNSKDNYIQDNIGAINDKYDYYCGPGSTGINDENGGVNSGETKYSCTWMALESLTGIQQQCQAVFLTSLITLSRDMVYTYGSTCFSAITNKTSSANNTLIDCRGHTIIATDGGTLLSIVNSSGVTLQNCYIKNFTKVVQSSSSSSSKVLNNTIADAATAISFANSRFMAISWNKVYGSITGILLSKENYDIAQNNTLSVAGTAINVTNSKSTLLYNNTASSGAYGIVMSNSTGTQMGQSRLTSSSVSGVACYGTSNSSSGGSDIGGNFCNGKLSCPWITSQSCK
ncbi:MAG: right-handed parallel beta-helix repeat-containing protein [Candidatus Micrarchaeota archaeon]|nr:right-handed parallel beta-helix repeat-containing protein [Candidatus Micrarchaeota archaeon]